MRENILLSNISNFCMYFTFLKLTFSFSITLYTKGISARTSREDMPLRLKSRQATPKYFQQLLRLINFKYGMLLASFNLDRFEMLRVFKTFRLKMACLPFQHLCKTRRSEGKEKAVPRHVNCKTPQFFSTYQTLWSIMFG